nr:hypothetical protein [Archangium violaceum]
MGAQLARLEARIGLEALLRRLPNLRTLGGRGGEAPCLH